MRRAASAAILTLLLVGMLTLAINVREASTEPGTIRVPDDYATIQEAVDAANSSDIIQVSAGVYYEHIKVRKSNLTLIGEGAGRTIVDGGGSPVVLHLHDGKYAKVVGFTLRNGVVGMQLDEAHGAVLCNNTVTNSIGGIWIVDSCNVTMRSNIMQNNLRSFGVETEHEENISCYVHDIDASNKVNGKAIYYLLDQKDRSIDSSTFPDLGYLALVNSNNVTVKDLIVEDVIMAVLFANTSDSAIENVTSPCGIYLWGSKHNSIRRNNFSGGTGGISMKENSDSNIVRNNLMSNNSVSGIRVGYSSNNQFISNMILWNTLRGVTIYPRQASGNLFIGNTILGSDEGILNWGENSIFYHNNFIDNGKHVSDSWYLNIWDGGYPSGGNFWSDYVDVDRYCGPSQNMSGSDGIWDRPYVMDEDNIDNYPLVNPYGSIRNLDTNLTYLNIQTAIDANETLNGHTIFVHSGTYHERVAVNKSISLLGESRNTTIICGEADYIDVVAVFADNVSISGFTIQNGTRVNVVLSNSSGCTISGNVMQNSPGGLVLHGSHLNLISNNVLLNNGFGSYLDYSHNNTVKGNLVKLNTLGIYLLGSDFNKIIENNIAENGNYWPDAGLELNENSEGNSIYHNNFPYNWVYNAVGNTTENSWDNGCEGNYWWDYQGTDSNHDGIGDTPYTAPLFGEDKYPLMNPYWNPADINHDLKVDIYDVVLVAEAYESTPSDEHWNPHCDVAEPFGIIDIYDIVLVCDCYDEEYSP